MKKKIMIGCSMLFAIIIVVLVVLIGKGSNQDYIDKIIHKYNPQGAAVAIIENGKITELKEYGYANTEKKVKVNRNTKFKIASISKTITAYAIMQLVEDGTLDLDVPISQYIKSWNIPDTKFDENKVTLRTLMSHTSGLSGSDECGYNYPLPSIEEALTQRNVKLKREPGQQFEYSEFVGFGVCQLIIEEVTGNTFEEYMKKEIFDKIGMENTNYDNFVKDDTMAIPYAGFGKAIPITPIVMVGAGGVTTTAKDLAKFVVALESYYKTGSGEMFRAQENTKSVGGLYGLGIIPRELSNGITVYEHNGTLTGWNAQLVFEPNSGNGLVVLTNSDKAYYMTYELMEKWGKNVVGAKVVDKQIKEFRNDIYIVVACLGFLLTIITSVFYLKRKNHKLVLVEEKKRKRKYVISSISCMLIAIIYFLLVYTDIPLHILFGMNNYFMFTFFPLCFVWVNILLIMFAGLIIFRSGYKKRS